MNPAPSIIGFTTSSGLGYGMLFVLALGAMTGLIPADRWIGFTGLFLALGFITGGLVSSTFHLGHPERALLALSQWRSSWLSREGLAAIATYLPALFLGMGWVFWQNVAGFFSLMALVAAAGAVATVYCTGMIYASLPPVRAWHHALTAPTYLGFALMTGALAVHFLLSLFGVPTLWIGGLALAAAVLAFGLKILCWRRLASEPAASTPESATGLGGFGLVRMLDPPHTQTNYLLHEMGYQIGRKHAARLRMLTFVFGLFGTLILTLMALVLDGWLTSLFALLALISGMAGTLLERWLFFAEAEHTVMLYYGGHSASPQKDSGQKPSRQRNDRPKAAPQRRPVSVPISGTPSSR